MTKAQGCEIQVLPTFILFELCNMTFDCLMHIITLTQKQEQLTIFLFALVPDLSQEIPNRAEIDYLSLFPD